jgi:two-component system, OmpR family, sensor histidine kinase BaeS
MRGHWPRHDFRRSRHGPPPFVRGFGCVFAAMIAFAIIATKVITRLDRAAAAAAGVLVLVVIVASFIVTLRRVAAVFRKQDNLRRQLMADVAHELRTPLSILQGRIEGLLDGVYPRDDARLGELLDETRHLSRLVEDLRTIANAEAGALELRKEPIDLVELIRDAGATFDRVTIEAPDELLIDVDPVRIREVLLNLLGNAVRHSNDEIAIQVEAQPRHAILKVIDRGSGIPPEELPRIFDRFHKGRDSSGSGLGLAIARNLVLAHGGTIDAQSRVGEGTTITVTLPMSSRA